MMSENAIWSLHLWLSFETVIWICHLGVVNLGLSSKTAIVGCHLVVVMLSVVNFI